MPVFVPRTHAFRCAPNEVPTDVVKIAYSDRVLLIVTQTGKPGTVMHVGAELDPIHGPAGDAEPRILLGQRNELALDVYARRLRDLVCAHDGLPLLLSIALVEYSPSALNALLAELEQHITSGRAGMPRVST